MEFYSRVPPSLLVAGGCTSGRGARMAKTPFSFPPLLQPPILSGVLHQFYHHICAPPCQPRTLAGQQDRLVNHDKTSSWEAEPVGQTKSLAWRGMPLASHMPETYLCSDSWTIKYEYIAATTSNQAFILSNNPPDVADPRGDKGPPSSYVSPSRGRSRSPADRWV